MRKTVEILGISVDSITMSEAVAKIGEFIEGARVHTIYTPNSEIMMAAQRDPELKHIMLKADMLTADGAGVVLASKLLGRSVPEKVSGVDLIQEIFKAYAKNGLRFFILGAAPGVAEEAAEKMKVKYPGLVPVGCRNGFFTAAEENEIVNTINAAKPDLLLVALGAPKQEKWIFSHLDQLNAKVCMGVGGSINILSGRLKPTPEFLRRNGLEWLHRLCREPRRIVRMMDLPRFMLRVLHSKITER